MTSSPVICPHCLVAVPRDRRCPNCGRHVDLGDWPIIRDFPDKSPCSAEGLVAPADAASPYDLPPVDPGRAKVDGRLETSLPFAFCEGKSCICIGESARYADVLIMDASPLHAALLLNRRTRTWWVFDCGSQTGTFVNGERIRLHELQDGDRIGIVGVSLTFRGNRLESGCSAGGGLAISVREMSFAVPGRERPILDRVSFALAPGEFVGVLGPSGCGKSSLVQRLVGLSDNYTGEVYVNGRPRNEVECEFRSASAYLPQNVERSLHDTLTLAEEIATFRAIHIAETTDAERENADCLSALGLSGRELSLVGSLSGGEKRRVGIALALLRKPRFLLLDEPGAGLDPSSEQTMMRHLRGIADQGRTVFCVTHELANAKLFDKVLILSGGHVAYFGPPDGVWDAFHVKEFSQLYKLLESGEAPSRSDRVPLDLTRHEFPEEQGKPSFCRVVLGYLRRAFKELVFVKKQSGSAFAVKAYLQSQTAVRFIWQPLGLSLGIRIACAYYFQTDAAGNSVTDIETLGFCSSLAVFWIGMNNSVRELVHDRIPGRCLERLDGVSFPAYVFSKIAFALGAGLAQTLGFMVFIILLGRCTMPLVESSSLGWLAVSPGWFMPLLSSGFVGVFCGLAVSAMSRKELTAVSMVPNVAILALLFSNPIVRFEDGDGWYMQIAKSAAVCLMPCHWPAKVIVDVQSHATALWCDLSRMVLQLLVYAIVSVLIIGVSQQRNERAWDGR